MKLEGEEAWSKRDVCTFIVEEGDSEWHSQHVARESVRTGIQWKGTVLGNEAVEELREQVVMNHHIISGPLWK